MPGAVARTLTDRTAPMNYAVTFQAFGVPCAVTELTVLKGELFTAVGAKFTNLGKAMAVGGVADPWVTLQLSLFMFF